MVANYSLAAPRRMRLFASFAASTRVYAANIKLITSSEKRCRVSNFDLIARPVICPTRRVIFSRAEWTRLSLLYGVIAILHILGWGTYLHYAAQYPQLVG